MLSDIVKWTWLLTFTLSFSSIILNPPSVNFCVSFATRHLVYCEGEASVGLLCQRLCILSSSKINFQAWIILHVFQLNFRSDHSLGTKLSCKSCTVSPKIRRKIGFSSKIGKLSATISPSDAWKFQALTMAKLEEVVFWIRSAHIRVDIYFGHTHIPSLQHFFHSRGLHHRRNYYSLNKSSKTIVKINRCIMLHLDLTFLISRVFFKIIILGAQSNLFMI